MAAERRERNNIVFQFRREVVDKQTIDGDQNGFDEYISDPNRPVPYVNYTTRGMVAEYVTDDQRFAAERTTFWFIKPKPWTTMLSLRDQLRLILTFQQQVRILTLW